MAQQDVLLTQYYTIGEVTGDSRAKMQWAYYFRNIVQRYQVMIEGWPDSVPFGNLSTVSSALPALEMLLRKWELGTIHWKTLSDEEFETVRREHEEKLESGEIEDRHRRTRSDKGTKRKTPTQASDGNLARRKKYKSVETVEDSDEENNDELMHNTEDREAEQQGDSREPHRHLSSLPSTPSESPHRPSGTTENSNAPHNTEDHAAEQQGDSCEPHRHLSSPPSTPSESPHQPSGTTENSNVAPHITMPANTPQVTDNTNVPDQYPDFDVPPFDCDTTLAKLDQIYGYTNIGPSASAADIDFPPFDLGMFSSLF